MPNLTNVECKIYTIGSWLILYIVPNIVRVGSLYDAVLCSEIDKGGVSELSKVPNPYYKTKLNTCYYRFLLFTICYILYFQTLLPFC